MPLSGNSVRRGGGSDMLEFERVRRVSGLALWSRGEKVVFGKTNTQLYTFSLDEDS